MRSNSCFLSRIRSDQGKNRMNEIEFFILSRIRSNQGENIINQIEILAFYLEFDLIKDEI